MLDQLTLVSDNCWGLGVYKKINIRYNSPFVNLFIYTDNYIKLLKDFKKYISYKLEVRNFKDKESEYIVGNLDDIELYFSHYKNKEKCYKDWNRRLERINYDNILFKCGYIYESKYHTYINQFDDLINDFHLIPNMPKISFTIKKYNYDNNFVIKIEHLIDAYKLGYNFDSYIDDLNKFSGKF
jgi:uncharacterized protein (DUF1919 family)